LADARLERFRALMSAPLVIFDFDGLLVDSERFHYRAYNEIFQQFGHTIDESEYATYWTSQGLGPKGEIERHNLPLDPQMIRDRKRPIFSGYCQRGDIRFFPEARELVERLHGAGKTLAIASGSPTPDLLAILGHEKLTDRFALVVGSDVIPALKPAPDVFNHVIDTLGFAAGEAVVFEDAEKGVGAAIAAAMPVIVVKTPETHHIEFRGADLIVDSHAELIDLTRRVFA